MAKQLECPHCGFEINTHVADRDQSLPATNDVSICINCSKWNKFDKDLNLIKFTEEDIKNSDPLFIKKLTKLSEEILQVKNKDLN